MIDTLSCIVNEALKGLNWEKQPSGLYEPIAYALSSGGKRIRPLLTLIGASLFGKSAEEALPAALAIEIFHNFTLLHDDVMDNASLRRGKPTVHIQWNNNTAILSGDQMLIEAYKQLSYLRAEVLPSVLTAFNKMGTEICEGQQLDVDFQSKEDVTEEEYIRMIRLKTSVLLGTALQIGAIIGGANQTAQRSLYEYGINLGLAFQIQDDLLDVYGNPKTFGKAIGGDILEGKKTFAYISALKNTTTQQQEEIKQLLNNKSLAAQEKIELVTDLYSKAGVKQSCEKAVKYYTEKALEHLAKVGVTEEKISVLKELATSLLARKD